MKDDYMTYIGPTLLVVNPYKFVKRHFTDEIRKSLEVNSFNVKFQKGKNPHNWEIACKAFNDLFERDKK